MSAATRRIRVELATEVLITLGDLGSHEVAALTDDKRIDEAELVLSERIQAMIAQLCDVGIPKARIAREIHVDPAALSELAEGGTTRLGFETLRDAFGQLESFLTRASQHLQTRPTAPSKVQSELLGYAGHPDLAKMKGSEALEVLGHNISVSVGDLDGALKPFGPHIKGASAVYVRDGHWILTAQICPGSPQEMTRIARDEIWHFEQWLASKDKKSSKPIKPRSAY
jgi:hypothetical protein